MRSDEPWPHLVFEQALPAELYAETLERTASRPEIDMRGRLVGLLPEEDELARIACSGMVTRALRDRLNFLGRAAPRLVCDVEGFESPVHPDIPAKAGTLQIYLTRETVASHGTKLWSRDGTQLVKEIPYAPNVGYAFRREPWSFHSHGPHRGDRWSLLVPYMTARG